MKTKLSLFLGLFIAIFGISFNCIADAPAAVSEGSPFGSGMIFLVIIVVMYFLMIRPQNKRRKEHAELVNKVAEGDEVLTTGGIVGKISKVSGNFIVLSVSDTTNLTIQKGAIAQALPKGTMKSL